MKFIDRIDWYKTLGYMNLVLGAVTLIMIQNAVIHSIMIKSNFMIWFTIGMMLIGALLLSPKEVQ